MTGLGVRTKFFILANEPLRCSVNIMASECMKALKWEGDGSRSGRELVRRSLDCQRLSDRIESWDWGLLNHYPSYLYGEEEEASQLDALHLLIKLMCVCVY